MSSTACRQCPLRKRAIFTPMSREELQFTQQFKTGELVVDAGTTILLEGSNSPQLYTVLKGMGTRYTTLENGRRQVINFLFPGDFAGLQAGLMGEMKHSIEATTAMTLCVFRRTALFELYEHQPHRAYDLTWISAVEEHFLGETIASLGQRDAAQRIAWALVRIYERLKAVGMEANGAVPLPFKQQDLADALGLSLVHTNKMLKTLRDKKLVHWQNGQLKISNLPALATVAMIDLAAPEPRPLI
ncbi:Crp/Fnr family transcriptional regulator [Leisingera aquaemixtae]|uniref:Crp/Fnr family transcriptional regulator n=1 Tax=Leisingera aquaemixtae TaxID=1396826 RepID=A0ABY5WHH4_9RHOB|nr:MULTISPECIES: Crp/Fnr family transcriptional regulator [Leisingera]QDI74587.1 Crp/Fnr family transcriptional regulator [Leisingera aquaemixtae]UWQ24288.1 Crp/Fnr family transcriptional regulator [Leisingera aquaemixtae]UWQ40923.1 Crp/Fnr family transcriptional regulator [Leisingera aquaemixtae]UWQ45193.1 Crp/Fnr family transcriptional regulator [Leisingera aquaemixtae]